MSLREYAGAAKRTTLSGGVTDVATSITVADATGWPTGGTAPFIVTLEAGLAAEEKILVTSRAGNTLTVGTRGYDGTTAASHLSGVTADHTFSAIDAREANAHINAAAAAHAATAITFTPAGTVAAATVQAAIEEVVADADAAYRPKAVTGARVSKSAVQSLTSGVYAAITFDTEDFDSGTTHDNVTNNSRITVPTAGKYLCVADVVFDVSATGIRSAVFRKNGTDIVYSQVAPTATGATYMNAVAVLNLAANDYVEIAASQTSGGALNLLAGAAGTTFSVTSLGS